MTKTVFVFSGPSGSGKSTIIKLLLKRFQNVGSTVSCTTRQKRETETDGVDYHFLSEQEFQKYITEGKFIEYVECYGNRYGTLKSAVENVLLYKDACVLDLDFEGASRILSLEFKGAKTVGILILPPSIKSMETRLLNRRSETQDSLNKRLDESFDIKTIGDYETVIINKDLEVSVKETIDMFKAHSIF